MIIFCNMLTYTVKLAPQAEGGYTVTVPALPGCISEGDTLDETLRNIQEAIEGCLLSLVKRGKQIPIEFSAYRDVHVSLKSLVHKNASDRMPKLPRIKPETLLIRALKKAGFILDHVHGSHYIFTGTTFPIPSPFQSILAT